MKDMKTQQLLCWSGMTDTEHSKTSGSNEEDRIIVYSDLIGQFRRRMLIQVNYKISSYT